MEAPVRVASLEHVTVVSVSGDLDVLAADSLRQRLTGLIESGSTRLVADLTGASFIDSTGLGVLVGAHKRTTERSGWLRLVVDDESLMKVLRVSALTQLLAIHSTLERALAPR